MIKDFKKKKAVISTAHEVYHIVLNIYKIQNDKRYKAKKERIKFQNTPEKLPIDLYLDEDENGLSPIPALEDDEEVKLEPEETIAKRVKLFSRKRKNEGTRSKILTPNKLLTRLSILQRK